MIPTIVTLQMIAGLAMPPPQFDHYPTEAFTVMDFPAEMMPAACGKRPSQLIILACTDADGRRVMYREDLSPAVLAKVMRHEYGHLNGWVH